MEQAAATLKPYSVPFLIQIVVQATRSALAKYKEKFAAIMWHPNTVPAYLVLADDQSRDELIAGYRDADLQGRYWIASTLFQGWPQDTVVQEQMGRMGTFLIY